MSSRTIALDEPARELHAWLKSVLHACDSSIFALASSEEHRAATILHVLTRNAKTLVNGVIGREGALYPPLCFTLAASCRRLGIEPSARNWRAALQNVLSAGPWDTGEVGLSMGTPAEIFKGLMDEALINAGVTDRPTILNDENRRAALGLAVNWGMRFLLAYALEAAPKRTHKRGEVHDLRWVRGLVTLRA